MYTSDTLQRKIYSMSRIDQESYVSQIAYFSPYLPESGEAEESTLPSAATQVHRDPRFYTCGEEWSDTALSQLCVQELCLDFLNKFMPSFLKRDDVMILTTILRHGRDTEWSKPTSNAHELLIHITNRIYHKDPVWHQSCSFYSSVTMYLTKTAILIYVIHAQLALQNVMKSIHDSVKVSHTESLDVTPLDRSDNEISFSTGGY